MKTGISFSFSKLHRVELREKETKKQLNMNIISRNIAFPVKFKTIFFGFFLIQCDVHISWSGRMVGWGQIFLNL